MGIAITAAKILVQTACWTALASAFVARERERIEKARRDREELIKDISDAVAEKMNSSSPATE